MLHIYLGCCKSDLLYLNVEVRNSIRSGIDLVCSEFVHARPIILPEVMELQKMSDGLLSTMLNKLLKHGLRKLVKPFFKSQFHQRDNDSSILV